MEYYEVPSMPSWTTVVFDSGDFCFIIKSVPITRFGTEFERMFLVPTEKVKSRYNINENELDYTISPIGVLIKEYPKAWKRVLCSDAQNGLIRMTCTFNGEHTLTDETSELTEQINRAKKLINSLNEENQQLQEALKEAYERIRNLSQGAEE